MRIDLHDLEFNTDLADANGSQWYISSWEGWDSPGQRQSVEGPTSRHGGVVTESMLDVRALTLSGVCKSPSEETFWAAYNRLLGVTNNLTRGRALTVYEYDPKTLLVIRGPQPRIEFVGVGAFTFEVPLIAPDPIKHSLATITKTLAPGQAKDFPNVGSFATAPVVDVTVAGTVRLKHTTGERVFTTGNTTMKASTLIDFDARTVTEGGRNRYADLKETSVWWLLQVGDNEIRNTGSATVKITYSAAWI